MSVAPLIERWPEMPLTGATPSGAAVQSIIASGKPSWEWRRVSARHGRFPTYCHVAPPASAPRRLRLLAVRRPGVAVRDRQQTGPSGATGRRGPSRPPDPDHPAQTAAKAHPESPHRVSGPALRGEISGNLRNPPDGLWIAALQTPDVSCDRPPVAPARQQIQLPPDLPPNLLTVQRSRQRGLDGPVQSRVGSGDPLGVAVTQRCSHGVTCRRAVLLGGPTLEFHMIAPPQQRQPPCLAYHPLRDAYGQVVRGRPRPPGVAAPGPTLEHHRTPAPDTQHTWPPAGHGSRPVACVGEHARRQLRDDAAIHPPHR